MKRWLWVLAVLTAPGLVSAKEQPDQTVRARRASDPVPRPESVDPPAPDKPRLQFLTSFSHSGDLGTAGRNSAAQAFEKLVVPYPQIRMVVCGHAYGISRRTDVTALGTTVFSHLFNNQGDPFGGVEWLRLLAFRSSPEDGYLDLWTFAPSGTLSTLSRTEVVTRLDLGQGLNDPVPATTGTRPAAWRTVNRTTSSCSA